MAEIKNVPGPPSSLIQNPFRVPSQCFLIFEQRDGIEISHYRHVVTDSLPAFIETHAPVEPDYVSSGLAHQLEQRHRTRTEMDHRNVGCHVADNVSRMR